MDILDTKTTDKIGDVTIFVKNNLPSSLKTNDTFDDFKLKFEICFDNEKNTFIEISYNRKKHGYVVNNRIALLALYNIDKFEELILKGFNNLLTELNLDKSE